MEKLPEAAAAAGAKQLAAIVTSEKSKLKGRLRQCSERLLSRPLREYTSVFSASLKGGVANSKLLQGAALWMSFGPASFDPSSND